MPVPKASLGIDPEVFLAALSETGRSSLSKYLTDHLKIGKSMPDDERQDAYEQIQPVLSDLASMNHMLWSTYERIRRMS